MALAENVKGWPVYGSTPTVSIMNIQLVRSAQTSEVVDAINKRPKLKRVLRSVVNRVPGLKQRLMRRVYPHIAAPAATIGGGSAASVTSRIPDFKAANPLSRQLTEGRKSVAGQASIKLPEIQSFLKSYFDGQVPQHPDEVFFDLIGTKC